MKTKIAGCTVLFVLIIPLVGFTQVMQKTCDEHRKICVSNTSSRIPNTSYSNWKIFVEAQAPVAQKDIDSVVYYLHKTFTPRIVTVRKIAGNPSYKFDLPRRGWGQFNILVKVYVHKIRTPISINHYLKL